MRAELALRVVSLAALLGALLIVAGLFGRDETVASTPVLFRDDSAAIETGPASLLSLVRTSLIDAGTSTTASQPVHLLATKVPGDTNRALLEAAKFAGAPATWTDSSSGGAVALEVRPITDPKGGYTIRIAAPDGTPIALRDSLGLIDSVTASGGGGSIAIGRLAGSVVANTVSARAIASVPRAPSVRRVLIFAEPGWEAKFTVAALEERGWVVDVRYAIGRNVTVTQGAPAAPDTARYAAVVALDSSVLPHINAIRRYAQDGGGVVISGVATTLREFGAMLPGRAGARQPGVPGGLETETPLVGLGWRPIAPDSNAAVIERSPRTATSLAVAAVVARRFDAGRVVASAYDGVWEWRMAGPEGSIEAHRSWWSKLVSTVAFAPEVVTPGAGGVSPAVADDPGPVAPYADALVQLGQPVPMPRAVAKPASQIHWEVHLLMVAMSCLLVEWGSRRLRGAK